MNIVEQIFSNELFIKFTVAIIGILIINFLAGIFKKYASNHITDSEQSYHIRKMITLVGYLVIILFLLVVFYQRLRGLTIAFGVIGAGVAFSLQEVIGSIAGWLAINSRNFYRIGDRVQLGGIKGDVIDISILRTTIMELGEWVETDLYTGRIVQISNSFVFKSPVYNYSGDFPFIWDKITIPVQYGCNYKLAREILNKILYEVVGEYINEANEAWENMLRKYLVERARIEPMITIIANDNWVEFTVRYITDYKKRVITKDMLFTRILEEFDKTNGQVKISSTTIQLVQAPPLDIRLTENK
ncbi:MAG: mechanosensitive ion channel [Candidatus Gastranaerophilales bacterium]|nr:mechanosensitive ion channel [Candidatus Gastranaerophilales bacterium]